MNLTIVPDLAGFLAAGATRRVVSVHARLLADDFTAVGLYHQLCGERGNTFLLESAEGGVWSRWSFVGVNAVATLTEVDGRAGWEFPGRPIAGLPEGGDPLRVLAETLALLHTPREADLPPLVSGMVGYLGYDVVRRLEKLPDSNPDDLGIPELVMLLVSDMAVLDHHNGEVWLIANAINFDDTTAGIDEAYADACARVEAMAAALLRPAEPLVAVRDLAATAPVVRRQRTSAEYQAAVAEAIEEIRAGEAFQIVLSQRFEVDCAADALDVYRVLRRTNPSPYLYLPPAATASTIVGSTPGGAGHGHRRTGAPPTRSPAPARGERPPAVDAALETELLADTEGARPST